MPALRPRSRMRLEASAPTTPRARRSCGRAAATAAHRSGLRRPSLRSNRARVKSARRRSLTRAATCSAWTRRARPRRCVSSSSATAPRARPGPGGRRGFPPDRPASASARAAPGARGRPRDGEPGDPITSAIRASAGSIPARKRLQLVVRQSLAPERRLLLLQFDLDAFEPRPGSPSSRRQRAVSPGRCASCAGAGAPGKSGRGRGAGTKAWRNKGSGGPSPLRPASGLGAHRGQGSPASGRLRRPRRCGGATRGTDASTSYRLRRRAGKPDLRRGAPAERREGHD